MKRINIAVVEDDLDDQDFLCHALEESDKDISVSRFNNGNDFLNFLKAAELYPAMVITDIRMPMATGWDVISYLKSDTKTSNIAIIVLSTSANEHDKQKAVSLGADAYFVKPYSPADYGKIVSKILGDIES